MSPAVSRGLTERMNHEPLRFDTGILADLHQLATHHLSPPEPVLPATPSRTRGALIDATASWHKDCASVQQAVEEQLVALSHFSQTLQAEEKTTAARLNRVTGP